MAFLGNVYWKDTKWNEFILWVHRRILNVASGVLKFAETLPCNSCAHQDDYGCLEQLSLGEKCKYKTKS